MISFKISISEDEAQRLKNRVVESVCKTSSTTAQFGKITSWKGALENEYFSVLFMGGVLVVSVEEREFLLGKNNINFAESQSLLDAAELVKTAISSEAKREIQREYNEVISKREQEQLTFADIMFLLNWKYSDMARVDEADVMGD